ncbi:MAG: DNA-binding protein [Sulfurimonas sp.]|nr:DNA-binding protein [Sulfurimonas sp.]
MKTITLKADDIFFKQITQLAKSLHLTKSELIRRSVKEYENFIKKQLLKEQIKAASYNVRMKNLQIIQDFDELADDGLSNV